MLYDGTSKTGPDIFTTGLLFWCEKVSWLPGILPTCVLPSILKNWGSIRIYSSTGCSFWSSPCEIPYCWSLWHSTLLTSVFGACICRGVKQRNFSSFPRFIITNFEAAVIMYIRQDFPNSVHNGCFFRHLTHVTLTSWGQCGNSACLRSFQLTGWTRWVQ